MPVEFGVWRIDGATMKLPIAKLPDEKKLEDLLEQHPDVVGLDVLVLGRQVPTAHGGFIDLLGLDRNGDLVVIELKRDRTPREVVAQTLDYGSWVRTLDTDALASLYADHVPDGVLDGGFAEHFDAPLPETLNARHQLVIVASELDPSTERIVRYLFDEYGVRINVLFFRYFVDGDRQYLARTWFRDPDEVAIKPGRGSKPPWDGRSYYVVFGEKDKRSWEDARRYGFVQAGGAAKYRKAMQLLPEQARVFVLVPTHGYVGVGTVTGLARRITEFTVELDGKVVPYLTSPHRAKHADEAADDPDLAEYVVPVRWEKAVPTKEGFWEKGLFATPTVVGRLRDAQTIAKVSQALGVAPQPEETA